MPGQPDRAPKPSVCKRCYGTFSELVGALAYLRPPETTCKTCGAAPYWEGPTATLGLPTSTPRESAAWTTARRSFFSREDNPRLASVEEAMQLRWGRQGNLLSKNGGRRRNCFVEPIKEDEGAEKRREQRPWQALGDDESVQADYLRRTGSPGEWMIVWGGTGQEPGRPREGAESVVLIELWLETSLPDIAVEDMRATMRRQGNPTAEGKRIRRRLRQSSPTVATLDS
jgi:hypothetical protein